MNRGGGGGGEGVVGVTFDRTLEIIRTIFEITVHKFRSLVPVRIIAASNSVDYSRPVPNLRPNNVNIIHIIEFVNEVLECISHRMCIIISFILYIKGL